MDPQKKQSKRAYQENPPAMGIFQIRNLINDKVFLGKSLNLPGILNRHRFQLGMGNHPSKKLQSEWREFGPVNFIFEILDELEHRHEPGYDYSIDLTFLEDLWLEKLAPYGDRGYNEPKKGKEERLQMIARNRSAE